METWSLLEILWTLVAALGAFFSFRNIREGLADKAVLEISKPDETHQQIMAHNIAEVIANGNIRRDSIRLAIQISFLGIGVLSGFLPSTGEISLANLIFSAILIGTSIGLAYSSTADFTDRVKIGRIGELYISDREQSIEDV